MGAIFDNWDVSAALHWTERATQMNRDRCYGFVIAREGAKLTIAIYFTEYRRQAFPEQCRIRADERDRRREHARAFRQPQRLHGQMQRRGATRQGDEMLRPAQWCQRPLQLCDLFTLT